jgi:hypothetical protein
MIYECRLNRLRKQHVYAGLLTILVLFLMNCFDIGSSRYWWSYSIGIALAMGTFYLIRNFRVRVVTTDRSVTVYHSGMVHVNIRKESIKEVSLSGGRGRSGIAISTIEGLKYAIPCDCFSDSEIRALLDELSERGGVDRPAGSTAQPGLDVRRT